MSEKQDNSAKPQASTSLTGRGATDKFMGWMDWSKTPLGPVEDWPHSLRTLVDMLLAHPLPMIVLWGPDLVQIYNAGYARIVGKKHPAALGMPTQQCWPEAWHINAPLYERVVRRGESVLLEDQLFPIHRDGAMEDAWFTVSYSPVRDDDGEIAGVILTVLETTERVLSERERALAEVKLRASEQRLRAFLAASADVVYRMSSDWGELRYVEGKEFVRDTLTPSHSWLDQYIHPDDQSRVLEAIREATRTRSMFALEHRVWRVDGTVGWTHSRAVPQLDDRGEIVEWVGTATDITERRRAEETLQQSEERYRRLAAMLADVNRRKDAFLATLAHELRNPLAPIRTGLEVMKLVKDDPLRWEEVRRMMEQQTQQLVTLIDDLLDVSRITLGKIQLQRCRVALNEVIHSAIEASRPLIEEAGHELTLSLPEPSLFLNADPHRLAQVFSNLLTNAAKYTPDGGHIWLTAERRENDLVVAFKDTGIGIPREKQEAIFEMFHQVEHPMQRAASGLGIGLTLAKSLVEMHGGSIEVSSEGPNHGSIFTVRLPILIEMTSPDHTEGSRAEACCSSAKCRVLVADDNRAVATMLSMAVTMLGNEVRTAYDGQEAIDIATEFRPHVILSDIGMPKKNGYEVAEHIRQQLWGQDMVLVAITGWGQDQDKRRAKEAGFDHHLVKPADLSQLQELLVAVKHSNALPQRDRQTGPCEKSRRGT